MTDLPCPVCDGTPRVLVAMRHPAMRRFTSQLLERCHHCWVATVVDFGQPLDKALGTARADLVIIDAADAPGCCRRALEPAVHARIVVIGPEPDASYRSAALAAGAAAWIPRERVAEELGPAMRQALGCRHDPCPHPDGELVHRASVTELRREEAPDARPN